ncbi:hypothetical protein GO003_002995 [Methylicorpusculum oleiharenae]|uniref:hypothetical protein n=1 Tax=Methylicorpusculum oleiharenae TaxID=1338687 RepID=UPI0013572A2A|nr:hypothetical protein [Methylicorpusculum oleiharenae]MCD2449355.1 hypothetical protein [Methylicorpusculum oleiharenae]
MQAYYETEVILPVNHHLNLQLPDEIPAGRVRIAVIYEKENNSTEPGNLSQFLSTLPLNEQGRSDADILQQIKEERDSWDET